MQPYCMQLDHPQRGMNGDHGLSLLSFPGVKPTTYKKASTASPLGLSLASSKLE